MALAPTTERSWATVVKTPARVSPPPTRSGFVIIGHSKLCTSVHQEGLSCNAADNPTSTTNTISTTSTGEITPHTSPAPSSTHSPTPHRQPKQAKSPHVPYAALVAPFPPPAPLPLEKKIPRHKLTEEDRQFNRAHSVCNYCRAQGHRLYQCAELAKKQEDDLRTGRQMWYKP